MDKDIIQVPDTVGELIDILKKYPSDHNISLGNVVIYDTGSSDEEFHYFMRVREYESLHELEIVLGSQHLL